MSFDFVTGRESTVIYFLRRQSDIWLVHAFRKKTQKTSPRNIEVARERIRWMS